MPDLHDWLVIAFSLLMLCAFVALQSWVLIRWDKQRVANCIATRGGHVQSIDWRRWGWRSQTRAYFVHYTDADGTAHRVKCLTSWLVGVYFAEDTVEDSAKSYASVENNSAELASGRIHQLERENEALRAELERLRSKNRGALR